MDTTYQHRLFHELLEHFTKPNLVKLMVETLKITRPTAYHYIECSRQIQYDHVMKLLFESPAGAFVRPDEKNNLPGALQWRHMNFSESKVDHEIYLHLLDNYISGLDPALHSIRFVSFEVPIFYYLYLPNLLGFKFYCWSRTVWNTENVEDTPYRFENFMNPGTASVITGLAEKFSSFPTTEFWNSTMLINTLKQIQYFKDLGSLHSIRVYKELMDDLRKLVGLLGKMAECGSKFHSDLETPGASNTIFDNRIFYANNTFLVESDQSRTVFTAYDNPNFMVSADRAITQKTAQWMDNIRRHSTSLVQCSELERKKFFDKLLYDIDEMDELL